MNALIRNITWTCAGLMFALTVGAPALADDTELLLVTPATATNNKPNILFILDTSGSMDSTESTIEAYVSEQPYAGACNQDAVYWTNVDLVPVFEFRLNDRDVELTEFKERIAGARNETATVLHHLESNTITAVKIRL